VWESEMKEVKLEGKKEKEKRIRKKPLQNISALFIAFVLLLLPSFFFYSFIFHIQLPLLL